MMDGRELSVAMTLVLQVLLLVDLFARMEVSEDALDVVAQRHLADEFDQRGRVLIDLKFGAANDRPRK